MTVDLNGAGGLLRVKDVAAVLDINKATVYKLIKGSELPAVKLGTDYRVDPADLREYIENHRTTKERVSNSTKELRQALAEKIYRGEMSFAEAGARIKAHEKAQKEAEKIQRFDKQRDKDLRALAKQREAAGDYMLPAQAEAALIKAVRSTVAKPRPPIPAPPRVVNLSDATPLEEAASAAEAFRERSYQPEHQRVMKSVQKSAGITKQVEPEKPKDNRLTLDQLNSGRGM